MYRILLILLSLASFLMADWPHNPISVNGSENPGTWNAHYMNGHPKIARIGNTVCLIGNYAGGERLYKSTNAGETWSQIDQNVGVFGSTIISGRDSIFYYFIRSGVNLQMIKFYKDGTPPAPSTIYSNSAVQYSGTSSYRCMSAAVDSTGKIYLAAHWGNTVDQIYVLSSLDSGTTWSGPYLVSVAGTRWNMPSISVTNNNIPVITYQGYNDHTIWFAKTNDGGLNWTRTQATAALGSNPTIMCFSDSIYIFLQNGSNACQWTRSADEGATWSAFATIETTLGYGDPTGAMGSDSTIYVSFRSSNGSGLTTGGTGDRFKSRFAQSVNWGTAWTFPDTDGYTDFTTRTVERCHVRYQTFFNYGGQLEWFWGQYMSSGTQYVIYYDTNTDMTILDESAGAAPAAPEQSIFQIKIIDIID